MLSQRPKELTIYNPIYTKKDVIYVKIRMNHIRRWRFPELWAEKTT